MNFKNPDFTEEEKSLFLKFPKLFRQTEQSEMESCMYWGIGGDPSWIPIIKELAEEINKIAPDSFEFAQIKSKWHESRIYYDIIGELPMEDRALISKLVSAAEYKCTELLKKGLTSRNLTV